MTITEALRRTRETLVAHHIEDAPLESELLLRHALSINRVQLYTEFGRQLTTPEEQSFQALVARRLKLEPTAYITGHKEFYGLDFYVDANVLIPRPETELLVEKAFSLAQTRPVTTIADIGTGCGAIAISLALSLPKIKIYATDISTAALEVARCNCLKHGLRGKVHLLAGDLLEPLTEPVDMIVANLPYVAEAELDKGMLRFEPVLALNGGPDGLEKVRWLCTRLKDKLRPGGALLLEIGRGQSEATAAYLHGLFPSASLTITRDLAGIERVVSLVLPAPCGALHPLSEAQCETSGV